MPSPTRIANKTIWALEDIIAAAIGARHWLRQANERARDRMDVVMLASLNHLGEELAEIESRARDARQGTYRQEGERNETNL